MSSKVTEVVDIYRTCDSEYDSSISQMHCEYTNESIYLPEEDVYCEVETNQSTEIRFSVYKEHLNNDKGLVSGWASVSKNADGSIPLDWQGDIISPEELENAAVQFMLDYRDSGERHQGDSVGTVVESIVLTKEKQAAIGIPDGVVPEGWFITVKLSDMEVFEKVKSGEYQMFSIQGTGERIPV